MAASDFILDIEQRIKGEAATELERTQRAFDAAAGGMKRFERDQIAADKALAALVPRLDEVKGKMAKAMEAGDSKAFWKAAGDMEKLEAKQTALAERSARAAEGFRAQAEAATTAGDALAQFAADQRAAEAATKAAEAEAKALAEQQANLEKHTQAAAKAAEAQALAAAKAEQALAADKAKAVAKEQAELQRQTQAATRAAAQQAKVVGKQQVRALTDSESRTKALAGSMKAAALAMVAFSLMAAKAAWSGAKWIGSMVFAKKAAELEEIGTKFKANLSNIFGGINLDPFMKGLELIVSFFDTSTASGSALKTLFEAIFQPIIDASTGVFPKIERFLLGMVIGALKVGIAVKTMAKEFDFDLGAFDDWPDAAAIGETAAYLVAAAVAALGAAFVVAAASVNTSIKVFESIKSTWDSVTGYAEKTVGRIKTIWSLLDFGSIARNLIDGFVQGIKAGIGRAVAAVENMATAAVDAAKSKLKVFSPSRVFESIGGYVAEGFAGGVDDGAPLAQASMAALVEPPQLAQSAGSSSTATIVFQAGSIVVSAGSAEAAAEGFVSKLIDTLESVGFSIGATPEAA